MMKILAQVIIIIIPLMRYKIIKITNDNNSIKTEC